MSQPSRTGSPPPAPAKQVVLKPREVFLRNFGARAFRLLDYLTLFTYVVLVSVGALAADYLIVMAVKFTLADIIANPEYRIVKQAFDLFQIGSGLLAVLGAGAHALFSAWSQIRFELQTMRDAGG